MPVYEYECEECGRCKTLRRSIADRDITVLCLEHGGDDCLTFNAPKMRRIISRSTSFALKGGGWYADGYTKKP